MVRSHKKTARKPFKTESCYSVLKHKWKIRAAALHHGISRTTLANNVKKFKGQAEVTSSDIKSSFATKNVFTKEMEDITVHYCMDVSLMGYGLTIEGVRSIAYEVASINNLTMPANWERDKLAGAPAAKCRGLRKRI